MKPASRNTPAARAVPWADPLYLDDDRNGIAERELQRAAPTGRRREAAKHCF